jgi:hypothetical protein
MFEIKSKMFEIKSKKFEAITITIATPKRKLTIEYN